ncbi:MAG: tetratricopeptide repeat protein [Thermoanaerobaculia bacterium]|nr:tetratricopeptide repeat protein [Thermoanaerobaculia bacterium]
MRGLAAVRARAAAVALVALAVVPHLSSIGGHWIVDDFHYVADNTLLDDVDGLATIWRDPHRLLVYYPLTFTTYWLENQLYGRNPRCFRVTNVALHAVVALLGWRLLRRLELPGAWLAAALFAVHPLHVDTVAWVAERKNVLSAALALGSALLYLRGEERRERGERWAAAYGSSWALFTLALLAKTPVLGAPLVAGLLVAWRRRRPAMRDAVALLPFVAVAAALTTITVVVERTVVAAGDAIPSPAWFERPFLAARATWFYVGKLLWPADLAFDYGRWSTSLVEPANFLALPALAAAVVALVLGRRRWGDGPLVAVTSFLILAAPALGFVTFYFHRYSFVAGHFVYLASLPLLAWVGAAWGLAARRRPTAAAALVGVVLALLGAVTWRHGRDYRDPEALARAVLRVTPASWLAHNHLGNEAIRRRDFTAAVEYLERAEAAAPGRVETQLNLAIARSNLGELAAAEAAARRLVALRDGAAVGHLVLGDVLIRGGRFDAAAAAYGVALERDPTSRRARVGLGVAQSRAGRHGAAIATLEAALRDDSANLAARTALAWSLAQSGRRAAAIAQLEVALEQAPDDPRLRANLELLRVGPAEGEGATGDRPPKSR